MGENKVQIAFYGTEELRQKLRMRAAERRTTVQAILDSAVAGVFANPDRLSTETIGTLRERQAFTKGSENLHLLVDFIYEAGPPRLVHALGKTLDAYAQVTHAYAAQGTAFTPTAADEDDDETDKILVEAREATARARRAIYDEEGGDPGNAGGTAAAPDNGWRKQA